MQGEKYAPIKPSPVRHATIPLVKWRDPSKAKNPSHLLYDLRQLDSSITLPELQDGKSRRPKLICFLYAMEPIDNARVPNGCDGTMPDKKNRGAPKKCTRVHADLKGNAFAKQDLQSLWQFLQHPTVSEHLLPTDALVSLMEQ